MPLRHKHLCFARVTMMPPLPFRCLATLWCPAEAVTWLSWGDCGGATTSTAWRSCLPRSAEAPDAIDGAPRVVVVTSLTASAATIRSATA